MNQNVLTHAGMGWDGMGAVTSVTTLSWLKDHSTEL